MKKSIFGRKLKRDNKERKALFKSLMSALVIHERIKTSESKAKSIKSQIDKLVTKAKNPQNSSLRILEQSLSRPAYDKMLESIAPRFAKRPGGFTRIVKLGNRLGDDSPVVLMEWVETAVSTTIEPVEVSKNKKVSKPASTELERSPRKVQKLLSGKSKPRAKRKTVKK